MEVRATDALIVVDVQNDFCPGGALPVNGGDRVVPLINRLMPRFDHVAFTRDWHPADHCSFSNEPEFKDMSWPVHCVADSPGAEFHGDLHVPVEAPVFSKGQNPDKEAYSGFEGTDLAKRLQQWGIRRIVVCGLALDYCVKHTALDGVDNGFEVVVVRDACRAVDYPPGNGDAAIEEMKRRSITFCESRDFEE